MCGLVGMVGTLDYKHRRAMKELLFLNSLRGKDSTGISCIHRNRSISTRKLTVPGYDFIEHPMVEKAMEIGDQLWIGHGRHKTQGEINKANAHPFEVLDDDGDVLLIGAHNGTLQNKYEIERILNNKFDTDSEGIFNLLVHEDNFRNAINRLRGAWSLVFWDPTTDTINFVRNEERPLVYAFSEDRRVMVWASEAWMLINACARNDIKLQKNDAGKSCYLTLTNHLYSLEIPQARDAALPELRREGGYEGAKSLVSRFQGNRQGYYGGYGGEPWWNDDELDDNIRYSVPRAKDEQKTGSQTKEETKETSKNSKEKVEIDLFDARTHIHGYMNQPVSKQAVEEYKKAGCVWCGDEIRNNAYTFLDEKELLCYHCLQDTHDKGNLFRESVDEDDGNISPQLSENSEEYKRIVAAAVKKSKAR